MSSIATTIQQVLIDLRSDKANVKAKSLENLHNIFDNRSEELNSIFKSNKNRRRNNDGDDDDDESLSWYRLFNELHNAIKNQCALINASKSHQSQKTLIAKNDTFKELLRKCINLANEQIPNVTYKQICQAAFECFEISSVCLYFDAVYLQIIYKHILNAKHSISELNQAEWSRILSFIFKLFGSRNNQISKLELLQCIPLVLQHASKYTYLVVDLHQYLPDVIKIVNEGELHNQIRAQKEILLIVYEFIRNLAVNQRTAIVVFTEEIMERLLKFYNFTMDAEAKVILMKIMHISVIIHSPVTLTPDYNRYMSEESDRTNYLFQRNITDNFGQWMKHLRNMMCIVEREIVDSRKRTNRSNLTPTICPIFVRMAAKLCSVVFWNENVWLSGSGNDDQQNKRRRQSMQLERVLELVEYEPSKFCWRWFAVLSQLLIDFPHVLQADDYQQLLQLLANFKPIIQYSQQLKCFNRIVHVMLNKQTDLIMNSTLIMESFCTQRWHEIMELSLKQAETDKNQLENIELLRILIDNKVIVSNEFIKNIIVAVVKTQTIKKSSSSIQLLISVLQNGTTDMVDDIQNLKKLIIHWLSSKIQLNQLKRVIENTNPIDKRLMSELYVRCVLSRKDNSNKTIQTNLAAIELNADDTDNVVHEYEMVISEIVQNLQYRMISKLIASDIVKTVNVNHSNFIEKLPEQNGLKAVLNGNIFDDLELALNDSNTSNDISIENFTNICASLSTNVNILNSLISYESIDGETFLKFLDKRIFIKIQQLNLIVGVNEFSNSYTMNRNANDVNEIVDGLISIWHDKYHPVIAENLFFVESCNHVIKWLQSLSKPSPRSQSLILSPKASKLSFEERIQLKCLMLLAHFSAYQDAKTTGIYAFHAIENYNFKYKRNEDLFIMFEVIKIILNQRNPPEEHIKWAFLCLQRVCEQLQGNCDYMELVVDQIPALIRCIKLCDDIDLHDELFEIISIFLRGCKNKKFGKSIAIKMIQNVQYFAKEFFGNDDEDFFKIIACMKYFLKSDYFAIQLAAVKCLTNIFNKKWLNLNEDRISCLTVQNFHVKLENNIQINELSMTMDENDRKTCLASIRIQMYCSIIGVCFPLRMKTWFNLIEFCNQQLDLSDAKISEIVEKLCTEMFNSKASTLLVDLVPHLIGLWLYKSYSLAKFPISLTECETQNEFLNEYRNTIILRVIQNQPELITELTNMYQESLSNILTTPILIKVLGWLTSSNCSADKEQKIKAVHVLKQIRSYKPNIDEYFDTHSLEIIEELITHMWDAERFTHFFETCVEFMDDANNIIDYNLFTKSLEYIQKKSSKTTCVIRHFCEMSPRKIIQILYSLKLTLKNAVCDELMLSQLLRICVLIDIIQNILIENVDNPIHENMVAFFVRDFIYFFGNIINSDCTVKLKLAACKYFHKLCQQLLPSCAQHFQSHLNYIVSILMPIVKAKEPTKMSQTGMSLLSFLIVDQTVALKQAIGQLDSFPLENEFDQLREIQHKVKYNGNTFSLLDEINYFLLVDKRKIEGLLSLKEHLSKKKNELQDIYKTIYDTRGFSEDCEKSPIHRLVSTLVSHIVQNVDEEKSLIAAKCLGELGPNDLGSIALKFDVQFQTYKICKSFDEAVTNLCELALEKLNAIFIHCDAIVLQAAAASCERILQSRTAASFLDKYPLLRVFETGTVRELPLKNQDVPLDLLKLFSDDAFAKSHGFWVKSLAIALFEFFDGETLAAVAAKQTSFAVSMVPLLVKVLLTTMNKHHCDSLKEAVNRFFANNFVKLTSEPMEIEDRIDANLPVYLDKVSIKLMLNVAECIRIHNQNSIKDIRLKLNYLHIAKAALFCEAYFTAILYGELASQNEDNGDGDGNVIDGNNVIQIRSIMKQAYQAIGEMDAVPAFLDPIKQKMEYLEMNRCWDQILIGIDAQSNDFSQYAYSLTQAGLYNLANKLTHGSNSVNYECAWRLADWNIIEGNVQNASAPCDDTSNDFHKYHYFALKSLYDKNQINVKIYLERALKAIVKMFKQSSYECTKNIYKNLMMLQLLQQVDEFFYFQFPNQTVGNLNAEFIINKWKIQDEIASCGFEYREPILAQRITMLQLAGLRAKRKFESACNLNNLIPEMILNLATKCREEGFFDYGSRYSAVLSTMDLSRELKMKALIEDAQLNLGRGDGEMAKHMIQTVIDEQTPVFTRSTALRMMGEYLADTRLGDIDVVIETFLDESLMFASNIRKNGEKFHGKSYYCSPAERDRLELDNRKRNYQAIAKYADREFQQIAAYMKSSDFEKKNINIERNKTTLNEMQSNSLTHDEKISRHLLAKTIGIDQDDVKATKVAYAKYLHLAIDHYIRMLLLETDTENNGSTMFRLFGLWLSNATDEDILKEIQENYKKIATHKFIALMPQITTHLSTDVVKDVIQDIVLRCAIDHPYHVLPKVFALVNAYKDEIYPKDAKQKTNNTISSSPRTEAATNLLQQLKTNRKLRDIIMQMDTMCEALIQLANTKIEKGNLIPENEPLRRICNLDLVHCPTVDLPVRCSGDYSQTKIGISKWQSTFEKTNGVNQPKRIECIGLNGIKYSQLLKGTDDLRQDAVMQQVFNIMNDMLNQSKITKKDRLHVRTYLVVPLSQRSGILEWCKSTMPLTEYLVGSNVRPGAHVRFRPTDWKPSQCRTELSKVAQAYTKDVNKKLQMFRNICQHIKPVFYHFFLEHFDNPGIWFERRMAYAHSLATTSMIGYILGIGDRHISNILIDKNTAELVHIDFGIAFEQGKCLPTPELIPFRLSRDLISALGTSGVEGVFRKSCEKTMDVLRQNKSTILTIVEILLHDPLYAWTLTNNKAKKRQDETVQIQEDQDINTMAKRALWRLEEKLDGKHVSRSEAISIKRHVEILINEATNERFLCRLFYGWQAYL